MFSVENEDKFDEKLTEMRPVVVLETFNLARYVTTLLNMRSDIFQISYKLKPVFEKVLLPVVRFHTKLSNYKQRGRLFRCQYYQQEAQLLQRECVTSYDS